jgi:predicted metal-binding protein
MTTLANLDSYCVDAKAAGAIDAVVVSPSNVVTAHWVRMRCQFGCSEYGQCLTCPPYAPTPDATRKVLDEYQAAILLHGGEAGALRNLAMTLEKRAFLDGYYKAFAYLCGPCWKCKECVVGKFKDGKPAACRHPEIARPAMEAAGIDVFATAHAAGFPIEVARTEESPQNYYALLLVE